MVNLLYSALVTILVATVTSTSTLNRAHHNLLPRQEENLGKRFLFRTDLKQDNDYDRQAGGQDPRYKYVLLSHSGNGTGTPSISFVNLDSRPQADRGGPVQSQGIPLFISGKTYYMNMEKRSKKILGFDAHYVTLSTEQNSEGWFYTVPNASEIKAHNISPQWDTWVVCDDDDGHPKLFWIGVSEDGGVGIPFPTCEPVRLYADPEDYVFKPGDNCDCCKK